MTTIASQKCSTHEIAVLFYIVQLLRNFQALALPKCLSILLCLLYNTTKTGIVCNGSFLPLNI